jgi:uncharacterized protein (UPF0335 family)
MAAVPDGNGGYIHKMVPAGASPAPKGKKKAYVPDPIHANPDASSEQLKLFVERLETLEEERRGIGDDIKDVFAEAKATGYDVKALKSILALRRMDPNARAEMTAILDTYKAALGLEI